MLMLCASLTMQARVSQREMEVVYEYLLSEEQKTEFEKLGPGAREEYVIKFWRAMDPSSKSDIYIEVREEFLRRLDLVNTIYELPYMDGWETDRGKVLVLCGYPAEIRRSHFGPVSGSKYEIWIYRDSPDDSDIVEVVFEDPMDSGEFVLRTPLKFPRKISVRPVKPQPAESAGN